ncbi:MAG: transaldolase [Sulfuricurvum sp.]
MYNKELNFSLWADFIERDFIATKLRSLIDSGVVNGATSNPTIFKNAFSSSQAYKKDLLDLLHLSKKERYESLAIADIQQACDALMPLFDADDDGFVSLEVDPNLCDDTTATINEARRLYKSIDRANVMIKIPATKAGYEAMRVLSNEGICINATLIFKSDQALKCADALKNSTSKLNVLSIFVSRIDRILDEKLAQHKIEPSLSGIYNATKIYYEVEALGLKNTKVLFASTGVKGDALPPCYYIQKLLLPNTINTAPIETIDAFVEGGDKNLVDLAFPAMIDEYFALLAKININFDNILDELIADGLAQFKKSFQEIMEVL